MQMSVAEGLRRYKRAHKFASAILSQSQVGFPDRAEVHVLASQIFVSNIEPADKSAGNTDTDNSRDEVLRRAFESQS